MAVSPTGVIYVVVCAAPPARTIHELLVLLDRDPRQLVIVTTPAAAEWIDEQQVSQLTSWPIRTTSRRVDEPKIHPAPDMVIAAPLTFNTINKWAAGINDNAALGVLNEAIGGDVPIIGAPVTKPALTAHPAFANSLRTLAAAGVTLMMINGIVRTPSQCDWRPILDAISPG